MYRTFLALVLSILAFSSAARAEDFFTDADVRDEATLIVGDLEIHGMWNTYCPDIDLTVIGVFEVGQEKLPVVIWDTGDDRWDSIAYNPDSDVIYATLVVYEGDEEVVLDAGVLKKAAAESTYFTCLCSHL